MSANDFPSQAQEERIKTVTAKIKPTFCSKEKAHLRLCRPTTSLHGEEPFELLDTEAGARLVEDFLFRIDHGIAA